MTDFQDAFKPTVDDEDRGSEALSGGGDMLPQPPLTADSSLSSSDSRPCVPLPSLPHIASDNALAEAPTSSNWPTQIIGSTDSNSACVPSLNVPTMLSAESSVDATRSSEVRETSDTTDQLGLDIQQSPVSSSGSVEADSSQVNVCIEEASAAVDDQVSSSQVMAESEGTNLPVTVTQPESDGMVPVVPGTVEMDRTLPESTITSSDSKDDVVLADNTPLTEDSDKSRPEESVSHDHDDGSVPDNVEMTTKDVILPPSVEISQNDATSLPDSVEIAKNLEAHQPDSVEMAKNLEASQPGSVEMAQKHCGSSPGSVEMVQDDEACQPGGIEVAQSCASLLDNVDMAQNDNVSSPDSVDMAKGVDVTQSDDVSLPDSIDMDQNGGVEMARNDDASLPDSVDMDQNGSGEVARNDDVLVQDGVENSEIAQNDYGSLPDTVELAQNDDASLPDSVGSAQIEDSSLSPEKLSFGPGIGSSLPGGVALGESLGVDDEASQMSTGGTRTPSRKRQLNNTVVNELGLEAPHKEMTAEQVFEFQWPPGDVNADYHMIQEQVTSFLGVLSFKRKYPDLTRRPVGYNERIYLRDHGVVTETQCDLGLTVLRSEEVYELVSRDYPDKYKELVKVLHKRERQRLADTRKSYEVAPMEKSKMTQYVKRAARAAADYNASIMREKREERRTYFDLQTMEVHYQRGRVRQLPPGSTALGAYPVALVPGQFADHYKEYTSQELKYFPMNSALYSPHKPLKSIYANPDKKAANSDSENSDTEKSQGGRPVAANDGFIQMESPEGSVGSASDIDSDLEKAFEDTEAQEQDEARGDGASVTGSEGSRGSRGRGRRAGPQTTRIKIANLRSTPRVTVRLTDLTASTKKKRELCHVCQGPASRNKHGNSEKLVTCSACNTHGHPSCLELTAEMVPVIRTYAWQCMECKSCAQCKDPYDEDKMMFCDRCDRGYHTFCVGVDSIPTGRWECPTCSADDQPTPTRKKLKLK